MKKRKKTRKRGSLHISLDLENCRKVGRLISDQKHVEEVLHLAVSSGCTIRRHDCEFFTNTDGGAPAGYTLHVTLAESHFWVSTWPECAFANIDIFVCNHTKDNSPVARLLEKNLRTFFGAGRGSRRWEKSRGPK